ncbi:MAG: hypothetical protein V1779_11555 [bacterium]
MKHFKTEVIKTKLFTGRINQNSITKLLFENAKNGWQFEGGLPIFKGIFFKKFHEILIFSKEWDNLTKEEKLLFGSEIEKY